jgi:hypothetical protein
MRWTQTTNTTVRTDYISVPEPGALRQLGFGCRGLWALNLRRQTLAFRTERERRSVTTTLGEPVDDGRVPSGVPVSQSIAALEGRRL